MPRGKRSRRAGRKVREVLARRLLAQERPRVISVESLGSSLVTLVVRESQLEVVPSGSGPWAGESPRSPSPSYQGPRDTDIAKAGDRPAFWTDITRGWAIKPVEVPISQPPGGTIPFRDPRYGYYSEDYFKRTGYDGYPPAEAKRLEKRGIIWGELWGP